MSKKRLVISFVSVVVLLALAGVIGLLMLVFPSASDEALEASSGTTIAAEIAVREEQLPTHDEMQAAEIVKTGAIVIDGAKLQKSQAEDLVAKAYPYTSRVSNVKQDETLPSGCEIVALAVALRAAGFNALPEDIARNHLRLGNDYGNDYIGSPWTDGAGLPPCIVDAGNSWLEKSRGSARVVDLTGTTFAGITDLVSLGYPVVAWTTEGLVEPSSSFISENGLHWYLPEHCVVVYGVVGDKVLVSDSIEGHVEYDREEFANIYKLCGNLAVFVQPE